MARIDCAIEASRPRLGERFRTVEEFIRTNSLEKRKLRIEKKQKENVASPGGVENRLRPLTLVLQTLYIRMCSDNQHQDARRSAVFGTIWKSPSDLVTPQKRITLYLPSVKIHSFSISNARVLSKSALAELAAELPRRLTAILQLFHANCHCGWSSRSIEPA
jgi:hypothetical protein